MTERPGARSHTGRDGRRAHPCLRRWLLTSPVLLFLLVAFVLPLGELVVDSVYRPEIGQLLPRTIAAIDTWDGHSTPGEPVQAAFARDLQRLAVRHRVDELARQPQWPPDLARSLQATATALVGDRQPSYRQALRALDPVWARPAAWRAVRAVTRPVTLAWYRRLFAAPVPAVAADPARALAVHVDRRLFARTLGLGVLVTFASLLLAWPLAQWLARAPATARPARVLLLALPLCATWVGALAAVSVVLQTQGLINDALVMLGWVADDQRPRLLYNLWGTGIGLVYLWVPLLALWLAGWMRRVPADHLRAARSLGARPPRVFVTVVLPTLAPGLVSGGLFVFAGSIGAWLTPALMGGAGGLLLGNRLLHYLQVALQPHAAAALAVLLAGLALALYGLAVGTAGWWAPPWRTDRRRGIR